MPTRRYDKTCAGAGSLGIPALGATQTWRKFTSTNFSRDRVVETLQLVVTYVLEDLVGEVSAGLMVDPAIGPVMIEPHKRRPEPRESMYHPRPRRTW
jgi:hypothetical protein